MAKERVYIHDWWYVTSHLQVIQVDDVKGLAGIIPSSAWR